MEDEQNLKQYPQMKQVLIVIFLTLVITVLVGALGAVIGARTELFLLEALIIFPALIFTLKNKYSTVQIFRLRKVNLKVILISIILGCAFTIVSDEIDRVVQIFFPMPEELQNAITAALKIETISDFIIIAFSAVVVAAIVEEMLFRGFVQTSLEHEFDVTKAVMSTALLFVIFHFNPWWSIQVMIFGIILGVIAWKSNSIIPSIIMHAINNSVALLITNINPKNMEWYLYKNHVHILILIIAIFATVFGIKLLYRFCETSLSNQNNSDFDNM
jgi:sodium transport system permease protein